MLLKPWLWVSALAFLSLIIITSPVWPADPVPPQSHTAETPLVPQISTLQQTSSLETLKAELHTLAEAVRTLKPSEKTLVDLVIGFGSIVVGIFAALAGFGAAFYTTRATQKTMRESRLEEHLFNSVQWFAGGTQKRAIGISVIEANWDKTKRIQETWACVLFNQGAYLLSESKGDALHEIDNSRRIRKLLRDRVFKEHEKYQHQCESILRVSHRKTDRRVLITHDHIETLQAALAANKNGKGLRIGQDEQQKWCKLIAKANCLLSKT